MVDSFWIAISREIDVSGFLQINLLILGLSSWKASSSEVWIWLFFIVLIWPVEVGGWLLIWGVSRAIKVEDEVLRWLRWSLIALRNSFLLFCTRVWLVLVTWYSLKTDLLRVWSTSFDEVSIRETTDFYICVFFLILLIAFLWCWGWYL